MTPNHDRVILGVVFGALLLAQLLQVVYTRSQATIDALEAQEQP